MITGLGTIGPCGHGREALSAALAAGKHVVTEVDRSAGLHLEGGSRYAALVGERDVSLWVFPTAARRMSFPSKLAVAAARMALAEAGIAGAGTGDLRVGIYLATTFGSELSRRDCCARSSSKEPKRLSRSTSRSVSPTPRPLSSPSRSALGVPT